MLLTLKSPSCKMLFPRRILIPVYMKRLISFIVILITFSCSSDDQGEQIKKLELESLSIGSSFLEPGDENNNIPTNLAIVMKFNFPIERSSVEQHVKLFDIQDNEIGLTFSYSNDDKTISALPDATLANNTSYSLRIGPVQATDGAAFGGESFSFSTGQTRLSLTSIQVDDQNLSGSDRILNVKRNFLITAKFSNPINVGTSYQEFVSITGKDGVQDLNVEIADDNQTLLISPLSEVEGLSGYSLRISEELGRKEGFLFDGFNRQFYTAVDSTPKFPKLPDEELLTLVQKQTFRYFWDFAHPFSGLARERNTSGDIVTSGGSGFGIMTIPVGIERGFITRQEGVDRIEKIVDFLATAERFHGAWPHWLNGVTGKAVPFSTKDDGGDLVETAFLIQGLLTVKQYLDVSSPQEASIIEKIDALWEAVEWDWYTKGGEKVLYWHWSPNYEWEMNHKITGWNEALIVYVLAASSPTHPIDPDVYHHGWAANGSMANGREFHGISLPLGPDYGGPMFFAHYSFLGLDPRNLEDNYANYWDQNVNHARIQQKYAVENPRNFVGYGAASWGLTASDSHNGYAAHAPTNDLGVITPTAALASMPYTPELSMEALHYFYYILGDKLWGDYGFYDAYNPTENWYADSYLAIDQGPIILMIENYRTGLLWDLLGSNPEIKTGLEKLGFTGY